MISHFLLTPPMVEPVTVADLKAHARIDGISDDALLGGLNKAARGWCEKFTRRAFVDQTWQLWLSKGPESDFINLPRAPLIAVTGCQVFDDNDTPTLWSALNYFVDLPAGRLVLRTGSVWPPLSRAANGFEVTYRAGYGADGSSVPEEIKLAIKQLALHWYEYRGEGILSAQVAKPPLTIEALLMPYRLQSLGDA